MGWRAVLDFERTHCLMLEVRALSLLRTLYPTISTSTRRRRGAAWAGAPMPQPPGLWTHASPRAGGARRHPIQNP